MAYIVMAYIGMAYIVMAYIVMAYIVTFNLLLWPVVMVYLVMAHSYRVTKQSLDGRLDGTVNDLMLDDTLNWMLDGTHNGMARSMAHLFLVAGVLLLVLLLRWLSRLWPIIFGILVLL